MSLPEHRATKRKQDFESDYTENCVYSNSCTFQLTVTVCVSVFKIETTMAF